MCTFTDFGKSVKVHSRNSRRNIRTTGLMTWQEQDKLRIAISSRFYHIIDNVPWQNYQASYVLA